MFFQFFVGLLTVGVSAERSVWVHVEDSGSLANDAQAIENYYITLARAGASHILASSFLATEEEDAAAADEPSNLVSKWRRLHSTERCDIVIKVHNEGSQLQMVTTGGPGGQEYLKQSPREWADIACKHALENNYDGLIVSLDGSPMINFLDEFVTWAIEATSYCRNYINHIGHAPKPAYFSAAWNYVYDPLVSHVDKFLLRFFDHNELSFSNYYSTWVKDDTWPSWSDIRRKHKSKEKELIVTKWIYPATGSGGGFNIEQFISGVRQAEQDLKYSAGIAIWKTPHLGDRLYSKFVEQDLPRLAGKYDDDDNET